MLPTTPAVRMVAPAPEEGPGEGEATPSPAKRATAVNLMRPHLKILPSLKETLRLLLEKHKHQRHLQVNVSGAIRSDIDSVMRSVRCTTPNFKTCPGDLSRPARADRPLE